MQGIIITCSFRPQEHNWQKLAQNTLNSLANTKIFPPQILNLRDDIFILTKESKLQWILAGKFQLIKLISEDN